MAAKTGYGRTVLNIQGKGIPNDGSSYRKTARPETRETEKDIQRDIQRDRERETEREV